MTAWLARIDWLVVAVVILTVALVVQMCRDRQRQREARARQTRLTRDNYALRVLLRELGVQVDLTHTGEQIDVVARWRTGAPLDWNVPRRGEVRH